LSDTYTTISTSKQCCVANSLNGLTYTENTKNYIDKFIWTIEDTDYQFKKIKYCLTDDTFAITDYIRVNKDIILTSGIGGLSMYTQSNKNMNVTDQIKLLSDDKTKLSLIQAIRQLIIGMMYYNHADNKIYLKDIEQIFDDFSAIGTISDYEEISIDTYTTQEIVDSLISDIQDLTLKYKMKLKLERLLLQKKYHTVTITALSDSTVYNITDKVYFQTYDNTYNSVVVGRNYKFKPFRVEYTLLLGAVQNTLGYQITT